MKNIMDLSKALFVLAIESPETINFKKDTMEYLNDAELFKKEESFSIRRKKRIPRKTRLYAEKRKDDFHARNRMKKLVPVCGWIVPTSNGNALKVAKHRTSYDWKKYDSRKARHDVRNGLRKYDNPVVYDIPLNLVEEFEDNPWDLAEEFDYDFADLPQNVFG